MASIDPFKVRDPKPLVKKALILPKSELDRLICDSQPKTTDDKEKEKTLTEEQRKGQEARKDLFRMVAQKSKTLGNQVKKLEYEQAVESANRVIERENKIESRKNSVLDLAYKRLFEETDRVKNFKIAKNLAVMLKERDAQVKAKDNVKDMLYRYQKDFVLGMMKDIERYHQEEKEKIEKAKRDKVLNAENWNKQKNEVEKKRFQSEWEHLRDGYIVREAASNYKEELEKAKLKQQQKIENYKIELDRQRDNKYKILEMHAQLDDADDKRAKVFLDTKQDMETKHKQIKEELDQKKDAKRQYVAKNLRDETSNIRAKEKEILEKAIRQAEAKDREERVIKKANQEEALKAIQDFYDKEMKSKSKRKSEKRRKGYQERRKLLEHAEELLLAENSKKDSKKLLETEAQHLQLHQISKKKMDKKNEKLEDLKDYLNHIRSLNDEEEIFQSYAQMEIAECEARGINTLPMQYAARPGIECGKGPLYQNRGSIRPKYYSSVLEGDELNHINRDHTRPSSKSRLGFMLH